MNQYTKERDEYRYTFTSCSTYHLIEILYYDKPCFAEHAQSYAFRIPSGHVSINFYNIYWYGKVQTCNHRKNIYCGDISGAPRGVKRLLLSYDLITHHEAVM